MTRFGAVKSSDDMTAWVYPSIAVSANIAFTSTGANIFAEWTTAQNETLTVTGSQSAGQRMTLIIHLDVTLRTVTFGTGFRSSGTVSTLAANTTIIEFVSNGAVFFEKCRTTGLTI